MADASSVPAGIQTERVDAFAPRDRVLRLYQAAPISPVWVGLAIVLGYLALFHCVQELTGIFSPGGAGASWVSQMDVWETVNGVILGYLLTTIVVGVHSARSDLASLRPHLDLSDAGFQQLLDEATNLRSSVLLGVSLLGAVGGAMLAVFDPGVWGEQPAPPAMSALFLWVVFRNAAIGWCATRGVATEFALTRGFARAAELVSIDLLDGRTLAPFARKSQRSLLGWVGFSVLFSLFFLGGSPARSNSFFLAVIATVLLAVFLIPLLGVRRRVAAAKASELQRVNACIRRELDGEGADSGSGPRLADWVAYRGLVEHVREWPINATGLLRALLFAALGIGSWLGGALVERLLGAALD